MTHIFEINIHAIITLLAIGNYIAVGVLASYKSGVAYRSTYREFMAGKLLQGTAWFLLSLRNQIPDILSIHIGNAFLFAGFSLEALALVTMDGKNKGWEYYYRFISVLGILFFWYFSDADGNIRVSIASLITLVIYGPASIELMRTAKNSRLRFILGILCGIFALFMFFRFLYGFSPSEKINLMTPGLIQTLSFLQLYFLMLTTGIGFLLMMKEQNDSKLAESEEKYRTLVEEANDGIVIIQGGKLVLCNNRMLNILGLTKDEIFQKNVNDLIHPADLDRVIENYDKSLKGEATSGNFDFRLQRGDGETVWVIMSASRINLGGTPAIMSLITDITERKNMEKDREKIISELQKALSEVKTLNGLLPICSNCKKIRDDNGYWNQIEVYIREHSEADFSHSLCPDCVIQLYPDLKIGKIPD